MRGEEEGRRREKRRRKESNQHSYIGTCPLWQNAMGGVYFRQKIEEQYEGLYTVSLKVVLTDTVMKITT